MKRLMSLAALAAALMCGTAQAQITDGVIKIGVMNDMSGTLCRPDRAGLGRRRAHGGRGFRRRQAEGHEGRDRRRRSPEQARRRLQRRAHLDRRRQGRRDRRRADLRRSRSRSTRSSARRTRCSWSPAPRRPISPARPCSPNTVHWTYDTWALANGTGKAHREDRRRHLVLPHRRLRLRPRARARHRGGRRGERRQGGRQGAPSAHTADFSSFLLQAQASKAKIIGLANAGGDTINSIKQAADSASSRAGRTSPACWCSSPTSMRSGCRPRRA